MGLVTFLLLGAFTLLYMEATIEKKPDFVVKAVSFLRENLDRLSIITLIYALIAALITPIMVWSGVDMIVRLSANVMLIVMTLPLCYDRIVAKAQPGENSVLFRELGNVVRKINAREKLVGTIALVVLILLFAVLFR